MEKNRTEMPDLASKLREEYDYMDGMPLDGWIWEFVRRNPRFQSAFETIKAIAERHNGEIPNPWPPDFKKANEFIDAILEVGPWVGSWERCSNVSCICIIGWGEFAGSTFPEINVYPDPKVRFCDFPMDSDVKDKKYGHSTPTRLGISIRALQPFLIREYDVLDENAKGMLALVKERLSSRGLRGAKQLADDVEEAVSMVRNASLDQLRIAEPENTLCVAISKKARMEEIETKLLPAIGEMLIKDKPKRRDDMWKYYIIVYDLKCRNQNASYENLATTLQSALRPVNPGGWQARTVENYNKQALHLIHGGYKKYLYL
jgi:hypothetical protein